MMLHYSRAASSRQRGPVVRPLHGLTGGGTGARGLSQLASHARAIRGLGISECVIVWGKVVKKEGGKRKM